MFQDQQKKKRKKRIKKSRKENENECSTNYWDHFLMSTRTTFHLPQAHKVQEIKKKNALEPKEENKKETMKEIKK